MASLVPPNAYNALMGLFRPQAAPAGASAYDQAMAQAQSNALARFGMGLVGAAVPQTPMMRAQALQGAFAGFGNINQDAAENLKMQLAQRELQKQDVLTANQEKLIKSLTEPSSATMVPSGAPIREGGFAGGVAPVQSMAPAPRSDLYNALTPLQRTLVGNIASVSGADVAASKALEYATSNATPKEPIKLAPGETLYDPTTYEPVYTAPKDANKRDIRTVGSTVLDFTDDPNNPKVLWEPPKQTGLTEEQMKMEGNIRTEFQSLPQVKNFAEAQRAYITMWDSAEKANQGGPSQGVNDVNLVYGFFKAVDPTSTVREGEFATAASSMGFSDRLITSMQKLDSGGFLSPEIRNELVRIAQQRVLQQKADVEDAASTYQSIAEAYNLDPARTIKIPRFDEKLGLLPGVSSVEEGE